MGDSALLFWGAPDAIDHPARSAVDAALDCHRRLEELNERWQRQGTQLNFSTGFGLDFGSVVVGNMGSESRVNYTIVGDRVNLCSRVETVNRRYGTRILATRSLVEALGPSRERYLIVKIDEAHLRGSPSRWNCSKSAASATSSIRPSWPSPPASRPPEPRPRRDAAPMPSRCCRRCPNASAVCPTCSRPCMPGSAATTPPHPGSPAGSALPPGSRTLMGLQIPHRIAASPIHGQGVFSLLRLEPGALLWRYEPGLDRAVCLAGLPERQCLDLLHYGYTNPRRPGWVVVCGDAASFWNFPPPGDPANAVLSPAPPTGSIW